MFAWYNELKSQERRTFWACFGGFGLDGMDFQIYTFAIPTLTAIWKLSPGEAGLIATLALLVSAFGGWITGILSDRFGRVLMLQITIAWFAFFTFLQGLSPGFHWLLGFPLGFFASGVFSGMGAFYTELLPTEVRGSAQGFCYNFGRGVAAVFPYLVGLLAGRWPLGRAIGTYAGAAYLLMVIAALALPETRGRDLRSVG